MDVAGSLPVGRSISEAVVARLLETDEVDDFLDRHTDGIHGDSVIDGLNRCGLAHDRIDRIVILSTDAPSAGDAFLLTVYGKQKGKVFSDYYPVRTFGTVEQALAGAKILQGILGDLEITPP